jgi:predicted metal-dependent peptidase
MLPPTPDGFTGKLPDDIFARLKESAEEFKKLWNECESFDLQYPHLVEMALAEPFLGTLMRFIRKIKTPSVSTAGVRPYNDGIELMWNPIFFKKELKANQIQGVLKHELYHVMLEHMTTRRQKPHVLWNVATDCAINSLIPRDQLPDFVYIPGELFTPPNPPPGWQPSLIAKKVKELPKMLMSEAYMAALLEDPEIQAAMQRAQKACAGDGDNDSTGSSSGSGSCPGQGNQSGSGGSRKTSYERALEKELFGGQGDGLLDDHDVWDDLSNDQRDKLRDIVRDFLRDCVRRAENSSSGWGNVPAEMQAMIRKMLSNEIDWTELVNRFLGRTRMTTTTSSLKRLNRRAPWDFPGRKRLYRAKFALLIDESGSVGDEALELFFAEMSNLGSVTEYDIIPFDHTVDEENIQHMRRGMQPNLERTRGGGTSFDAAVEYVNGKLGLYDAAVILTDGACSKPVPCVVPLAYILAPNCELMFEADPENTIIKMTGSS